MASMESLDGFIFRGDRYDGATLKCTSRFTSFISGIALLACGSSMANCWDEAGARFGIDPSLLKAIAWKESRGWTHAIGPQLRDGHRALGLMQINSIHLPQLQKHGIRREHLFDPCVSQHVGAWILADCIHHTGNTWAALGCYVAGPASRAVQAQARYAVDVQAYYEAYSNHSESAVPTPLTSR